MKGFALCILMMSLLAAFPEAHTGTDHEVDAIRAVADA
jgi:hypothetical protein